LEIYNSGKKGKSEKIVKKANNLVNFVHVVVVVMREGDRLDIKKVVAEN